EHAGASARRPPGLHGARRDREVRGQGLTRHETGGASASRSLPRVPISGGDSRYHEFLLPAVGPERAPEGAGGGEARSDRLPPVSRAEAQGDRLGLLDDETSGKR